MLKEYHLTIDLLKIWEDDIIDTKKKIAKKIFGLENSPFLSYKEIKSMIYEHPLCFHSILFIRATEVKKKLQFLIESSRPPDAVTPPLQQLLIFVTFDF